jgi:membrane fusion protein
MKSRLFRPEVLARREQSALGTIVLVRPLSFAVMTAGAAVAAVAFAAFMLFGEYTKKARVAGELVPAGGVLKLHAREPAVVRERRVQEGQRVRAGEVLFVLESGRTTADGADLDAALQRGFTERGAQLEREARAQQQAFAQERAALQARLDAARAQRAGAAAQVELQQARDRLAQLALARQRDLAVRGLVSAAHVEAAEAALTDEQGRTLAAARSLQAAEAEIAGLTHALAQLAARSEAAQAAGERARAQLTQEADEFSGRRAFALRAPRDGIVTAIQAHVGQTAQPAQPLATLLPAEGELLAHLYVPSRAVGFIEPGRAVLLRYQAYPYQKFGQHPGRVESVSRTALSPAELAAAGFGATGDSLYRVLVRPAAQHVPAYGEAQPLQAGMRLEADVLLERRRLVEWLFEPLLGWRQRG